ncbi:MAG: sigma-54 dependent transcriptional regulator [Desulfobacterales bacterium]|jgi:DNA-binding NtrC family response regulator|nr:sigma-54 dependent transcriptional regulator [Desulfobacterales bacterium]
MQSFLVISTDTVQAEVIGSALGAASHVEIVPDGREALKRLHQKRYDLMFFDIELLMSEIAPNEFQEALNPFTREYPLIPIIVMSPQLLIRQAVMAVKAGVYDYLTYPLEASEINYVVDSLKASVIIQSELDYLREQFWKADALDFVRTQNDHMRSVFNKIRSVAPTKTPILIIGETGTGKGLIAKLIHAHSNRSGAQFISVHCGAIPDTLLESELYGHEKGSFTGASRRKLGKFEIANSGSIFLDEIGTITPSAQIKLLQVLQDGTFSRVGGEGSLKTNARVISASNADLKKMTMDGLFRKDLYYRLNVFPIEIPPLRERIEDIPLLVEFFLKKLNREFQKDIHGVHPQVLHAFRQYSWPGNIRELENLMERAYILESSSRLTPDCFPKELFDDDGRAAFFAVDESLPLAEARRQVVDNFEQQYLKSLMARNNGKINKSAGEAGITTRQLHKLMLRYGLRKEEFKR